MTIYGTLIPGAAGIARNAALTNSLTEKAKWKIKILDWHKAHGDNQSLTARRWGIGRMTLYRWQKRFKHYGITGLNDESTRPKRGRQPVTSWQIVSRAVQLRKQYPAWSKKKIRAIMFREGIVTSESTVGRIFKRRGLIGKKESAKRRKAALRPRMRFPKGLMISNPGDMVQMDTKHIVLTGGRKFYQFTAIDVLTKHRILRVYPSESSRNGKLFLQECIANFPFPVKAIQTDNGAPFLKDFDKHCKTIQLPHYFIYPRKPKQNTYVEISHGADKREFYRYGNKSSFLEIMRANIREWENTWNTIRPHEALGQMTPVQYYWKIKLNGLPTNKAIVLQN